MSFETLLFELKERVATVKLNRPERMNAWTPQMAVELSRVFKHCHDTPEVRAVVLTGAGRAFCAGADLASGAATFSGEAQRVGEASRRPAESGPREWFPWMIDKPVIAAINGHAIGVGITYPMMCDMRLVAEDAKLQFAFVRRGVIPELASHVIVSRVAGLSRAADLLLSGRVVLGREAAQMGLASEALPAAEVLAAAWERAREIAVHAAPMSVAISKRLLWEGVASSVPQMLGREGKLFAWIGSQADAKEGVVSFLEKREPRWNLDPSRDKPDFL